MSQDLLGVNLCSTLFPRLKIYVFFLIMQAHLPVSTQALKLMLRPVSVILSTNS